MKGSAAAGRRRAWGRNLVVAACALSCAFVALVWQANATKTRYGRVTVVMANVAGAATDGFSFQTDTSPVRPSFSLAGGQSRTFEIDCNVGEHCQAGTTLAITEDLETGYTMTGAVCRSRQGTSSFPSMPTETDAVDKDTVVSGRTLSYQVSYREWVVCWVTNERDKGSIKVVKDVVGVPGTTETGRFDLLVDGRVEAAGIADDGATPVIDVTTGVHSVTEAAGARTDLARYDERVDCSAAGQATVSNAHGPDVSLHVGKGEAWTCVIRNSRRGGTLKIVEDLQPATDNGRFDLLIDGTALLDQAGDRDATAEVPVTAGEHTIGERAVVGSNLADYVSDVECERNGTAPAGSASGSDPLTVSVGHGDAVACTITNRRKATVTVRTVTRPAQSGGPGFAFRSTLPGAGSFSLAHGAERTFTVAPREYSVTQADPTGQDHRLGVADCTERFGVSRGSGARRAFTADPGDHIVCTYTNTRVDRTLQVRKTGPGLAYSGDPLTFGFAVTNDGDEPLTSIAVRDDTCPDVVGPTAKAGGDEDGTLDPGETWRYTCSYVATPAVGDANPVTSTVTATGRDRHGDAVKDTATHDTELLHAARPRVADPIAEPQPRIVVAARRASSAVKPRGPSGCATRAAIASVTDREIVRVTWYLDGRRIAARTKADRKGRWTVPIERRSTRRRSQLLVAELRFAGDAGAAITTLWRAFGRCRPAVRRPTFTG